MQTNEIIEKFRLYVDDGTELSSAEELDLAEKVYQKICSNRPWEFLKETATGSIVSNEITLPSDFSYFANNYQSTDSNVAQDQVTSPKVIFVGTNLDPYRVVNFTDRRKYANQSVCYIDPSDSKIKFLSTPTGTSYEFDYIKVPSSLTLGTSPIFPARFHDAIAYGMAVDDFAIQLFDKARSYAAENQVKYNGIIQDMAFWNAQFLFN